jgi:hypothetical protein
MKNLVHGILMITAMAGVVQMGAQTAATTDKAVADKTAAGQTMTADEIVSKWEAAIGGKDAISKVKSLSMETSVQVMGTDNPSTTTVVDGVGYKTETEINGGKIIQCFNDKGGWMVNPMAGQSDPTPMPDDIYNAGKAQINIGGPLYGYAAKGSKIELMGKDGTAYKIKLTSKDNVSSVYSIDSTSFLVTTLQSKGKMQDQDVDITTKFSDYRKTDVGYLIPYAIDVDFGGRFGLSIAVKTVALNKTVDPAMFAMPGKS